MHDDTKVTYAADILTAELARQGETPETARRALTVLRHTEIALAENREERSAYFAVLKQDRLARRLLTALMDAGAIAPGRSVTAVINAITLLLDDEDE
jgi:hypothetical protein